MAFGSETSEKKQDLDWDRYFFFYSFMYKMGRRIGVLSRTNRGSRLAYSGVQGNGKALLAREYPPWFLHMGMMRNKDSFGMRYFSYAMTTSSGSWSSEIDTDHKIQSA